MHTAPRHLGLSLAALLLLGSLGSCAKQGYPNGGPRDTQPPQAAAAKPTNGSLNFSGNSFYIPFDEYVVLRDANNNVLISPPLNQKPTIAVKGRGVQVSWTDTLLPNTTYLFQFKDAIADFTEGNILSSYEYAFSTGSNIDTLMLAGRVVDARNGKPCAEPLTLMAYRREHCLTDTTALATKPDYVTRSDRNGNFAFHYIPAGNYRLVAADDKNRNLLLDSTEAAAWDTAFFASAATIDSASLPTLRLSTPDRRRQRLLSAQFTSRSSITIATLLPMQQPTTSVSFAAAHLSSHADTLRLWLTSERADSATFILTDPSGLADTLRLRYRPPTQRSGRHGQPQAQPEAEPLMRALCVGTAAFYDDLRIAFANPVQPLASQHTAELLNLKDSTTASYPILLDSTGLTARIDASLRSGTPYSMYLPHGLFADIYGHPTDSLRFNLTPKDYGTLTLRIDNYLGLPLVVELLDSRDTVVARQTLSGSGRLHFAHLPAAEYRVRAVADADSNGLWTPGDYTLGRQPEQWYLYDKTLQMREKWEVEERWPLGREATAAPAELGRPAFLPSRTLEPGGSSSRTLDKSSD